MTMNNNDNTPSTNSRRIADLSDDDKPREKALRHGIRTLSDTELIAILLGGGIPGKSVIDLSRELYDISNRSLSDLARMSVRDMCKRIAGIGPAKAITIAAALELGARRKDLKSESRPRIRTSSDAYEVIRNSLQDLAYEEFWIILLSRANMVIATTCISSGGTAATVVDPKIIMKHAIEHLASSSCTTIPRATSVRRLRTMLSPGKSNRPDSCSTSTWLTISSSARPDTTLTPTRHASDARQGITPTKSRFDNNC